MYPASVRISVSVRVAYDLSCSALVNPEVVLLLLLKRPLVIGVTLLVVSSAIPVSSMTGTLAPLRLDKTAAQASTEVELMLNMPLTSSREATVRYASVVPRSVAICVAASVAS